MAETDIINVPCLDFGEGRIVVTTVHTDEWAGIELSDAKSPHKVGEYVSGENGDTGGPIKPSRENVYMRFLNVESIDVVIAALQRCRSIIKARDCGVQIDNCAWCKRPKSEHAPNSSSVDPTGLSCPVEGATSQFFTPLYSLMG